jgi:hypothetical protein
MARRGEEEKLKAQKDEELRSANMSACEKLTEDNDNYNEEEEEEEEDDNEQEQEQEKEIVIVRFHRTLF